MTQNDFDRLLMEEMGQLPPQGDTLNRYTPWQSAMDKILWGLGLNFFRVEFFGLQYLLPLLGSVLLYLGCRSLRQENRGFRLCWWVSLGKLLWHMAACVINATPLLRAITDSPLNAPLSALLVCSDLLLLFSLRAGVRAAFAGLEEAKPRDWLGRGLAAYVLALAIALWCDLVPLTEEILFGVTIIDEYAWLYHGRSIAAVLLILFLLVCISRQSEALAGHGYQISPVPVRFRARTVLLAVFGTTLLALPIALYLSGHIPTGPARPTAELTREAAVSRDRLIALGLPRELAQMLDEEELLRCAGATEVCPPRFTEYNASPTERARTEEPRIALSLDDLQAELSSWLVELPGGQVRQYCFFRYTKLPALRLQELFSLVDRGNYPTTDYAARLLWEVEGETLSFAPEVHLAGGMTAEEMNEDELWWYEHELDRLGHTQHYPWFQFSIPKGCTDLRGYLAHTVRVRPYDPENKVWLEPDGPMDYTATDYYVLRHQSRLLHYPFQPISDFGGSTSVSTRGVIHANFICTSSSITIAP